VSFNGVFYVIHLNLPLPCSAFIIDGLRFLQVPQANSLRYGEFDKTTGNELPYYELPLTTKQTGNQWFPYDELTIHLSTFFIKLTLRYKPLGESMPLFAKRCLHG